MKQPTEVTNKVVEVELEGVALHLLPKLEGAVNLLDQLLKVGHCVYVHCTAGLNRAPSVVISHLAWNRGMDLDAAHRHVAQSRYCEPYLDAIRRATENRQTVDQ